MSEKTNQTFCLTLHAHFSGELDKAKLNALGMAISTWVQNKIIEEGYDLEFLDSAIDPFDYQDVLAEMLAEIKDDDLNVQLFNVPPLGSSGIENLDAKVWEDFINGLPELEVDDDDNNPTA